jgi:predicted DCC family thiol-disulfide oxidoreductase YuxK
VEQVDPKAVWSIELRTLSPWRVEVFYDGECPLCRREIDLLRRFDRRKRIRFTDIAAGEFRPEDYGKTMDQLMAEIHGRLPDGRWVIGVEVFRQLYAALGLGPVVAVTRLPGLSHGLDFAYRFFAKRRLQWTGRCSAQGGHCGLPE